MCASDARLRVFLVEDSPVIRENLVATLEEIARVEVVGWADEEGTARQWLESAGDTCDLVVVDVFLRRGSGLGLLDWLASAQHPVRRVVLSNYASPDMRRRCLARGADAVFDKPDEVDALIEHCRALAESAPDAPAP
ncbi:response regulator [Piscinibacter sp.]|uniref:response regulator n=1 Tax=Piscinibacter sp. TaxID=1903157 RepID=UPI0039E2CBB9